jgi:fused signal recognition particle receptor
MQIDAFDKAVTLTGLIVTKVDGSAKAGFLAALAKKRPLPVYFLGTGEKIDDLLPFQAHAFAAALVE